jgi:hypothetical protein
MSYLRCRKRKLKDGTTQGYWYRCEAYWEGGRSHERILEYLGTNPLVRNFPLDPPLARKVAAIVAGPLSPTDAMVKLKDLGFDVPFRPRQLVLLNNPPLRRLALRVE